jgi:hypothetical protein
MAWKGESIHDAILSQLTSPPTGKRILKLASTVNPDGSLATLKYYDENNSLLFTLTFTWNSDGSFVIIRTDA